MRKFNVISIRTLLLVSALVCCLAIPTAYLEGRIAEARAFAVNDWDVIDDVSGCWPCIFVMSWVGGPAAMQWIARAGVLLIGSSLISIAFDFAAPRNVNAQPLKIEAVAMKDAGESVEENGATESDTEASQTRE